MPESQLKDKQLRFPAEMNRDYPMLIDGHPVTGGDATVFQCVDPYEDAPWGRAFEIGRAHV